MPGHGKLSRIAKALTEVREAEPRRGLIVQVAQSNQINAKTLAKAVRKERSITNANHGHPSQRLIDRAQRRVEPRGATSHRLFTDAQEDLICAELKVQYPRGFTSKHILKVAALLFHNTRAHHRKFSKHWLLRFKQRSGITSNRFHVRKITQELQGSTWNADIDAACEFLQQVEDLSKQYPSHLIINVDETPSYVRNAPSKMLHFVGSPPPWSWSRVSEKNKVTVIGACTAAGTMIRSAVIAKGTTNRCEKKYRHLLHLSAFIQHTSSGNTTSKSFVGYLKTVIIPYVHDQPAVLILDAYAAHLTEEVRNLCSNHHIELVQVPDRATSELQPLDCAVFGAAKNPLYQSSAERIVEIVRDEDDQWEATAACVQALNHVSPAQVLRGWKLAFPFMREQK
jgi:transposase